MLAWDIVNEPLSGSDSDGDELYDLQSAKNVPEAEAKNNFYWQDYLGENYVRTAVELARTRTGKHKALRKRLQPGIRLG